MIFKRTMIYGCFYKLGALLVRVLITRALLSGSISGPLMFRNSHIPHIPHVLSTLGWLQPRRGSNLKLHSRRQKSSKK